MIRNLASKRFFHCMLAAFALAAVPAGVAEAAVPQSLVQQGRLLDTSGAASTGTVSIQFTIYDAATGGNVLISSFSESLSVIRFYVRRSSKVSQSLLVQHM